MRERMQRFSNYMNYKGLNDNQVTAQCDLSQGLLGQARKGKSDLGDKTINKILNVYQDLNRVWLLTGDGNMLSTSDNIGNARTHVHNIGSNVDSICNGCTSSGNIPTTGTSSACSLPDIPDSSDSEVPMVRLVPISVQGSPLNDFDSQVMSHDCELMISPVKGADFAMQVSGDSMSPEYPEGSRVFVKRIKDGAFIEWGRVFVLNTCNGTVLKVLVPSDKENCVRCISLNPDPRYAPFDVNMDDVYGIYRVLLCMSMK